MVVGSTEAGRFLAAIEPYHGNVVAIYTERDGTWPRRVIETGAADRPRDRGRRPGWQRPGRRRDRVRGKGHKLFIYAADDERAERWTRHVLDDGGMAAAACVAGHITGDGQIDIGCMGSGTGNVKVYENLTRWGRRTWR